MLLLQLKQSSILVEQNIPIYDLREVMQQIGLPIGPRTPIFDQLQVSVVCHVTLVLDVCLCPHITCCCWQSAMFSSISAPSVAAAQLSHSLALQGMPLDSPQVEALLRTEKEEEPPFPGARRILNWEQRMV